MSLSLMHPAKRRKIDGLSSRLSKPFKSPMRVDIKTPTPQINPHDQTLGSEHAQVTDHTVNSYADETELEHSVLCPSPAVLGPPLSRSRPTRKPSHLLSSSPRGSERDAEYTSLQKQSSALVLQLSQVRQALDTAQQALKIQCSDTDGELELLIQKWRLVSREAAEELFVRAQDRVNRMGGVGAWQKRNHQQTRGWDAGDAIDGHDLTDEQKDVIEEQKNEMECERLKYGTVDVEDVCADKDDESFTMDMMLQSLHVELELIGYDTQSQRWTD